MEVDTQHYDDIIIGNGKAGKTLAPALVADGRKTALVERSLNMIGGGCINIACIPTKTMVASANVANIVRNSAAYGVKTNTPTVNLAEVIQRKRSVVQGMREMNLHNLETALDNNLIVGEARFVAPKKIAVTTTLGNNRLLTAERLFINTGTRPLIPSIPGLTEVEFLTSESIMELEHLPEHLIVLGSGYIGLEFAQMFRRFGSFVTVIGQSEQILSQQDPDIAIALQALLEKDGIEFLLKAKVLRVDRTGNETILQIQVGDRSLSLQGSHLLIAVGRAPNTESLNLPAAGVATDTRGFIQVNDRLETNVPGIWALGDINGGPQYTHISLDDYRIIKANLIDGGDRSTGDRLVPSCLFIDPELAHVGLTETEAQQQGYAIRVAKVDASAVPRARTLGQTDGLLKAIVDADTGRILGCSLLCHEAGEVISTVQMVMQAQMPYTILRDGILTHPTMTEGLNILFSKL
ncbi:pyridine nucleotide-disulfide oxidoreductase dimerization region [Nostoc commune NIES-4072]|uniref:Pyridine nucleotide-disulfide oxidoreductase dimerization region n=1 Tax=Nostoc commune NIES-4072 TaxID=2005467 RepID=A0A2R5FX59_NOSCO|nr:mercuric reductase [Nostoc commune]BBD70687.1 pyridine nucleotide-disulfide oxidoreductase dimerization region [Nostoc commune HK-02]GBG23342.1 pyridine nucleotide-disulfide oxidoreductase dimerization region [Nostoc commune NIES-4072]